MRKMLTKEQVQHNKDEVKELVKRFVKTDGDNPALILDNSEWIGPESYIDFMRKVGVHFNVNKMLADFMRKVGVHFNVNKMLATDCYKNRLQEGGLTFLEMGYMLMQAYDFVYLNEKYGCTLEVGGSDQWANMVAGVELARKMDFMNGKEDRGLETFTCPLLVKADGEKMGKTASGTLWVSRDKTTVYDFYQMFINTYDEDVERLLAFFSDYEMEDIKRMCQEDIRNAKKVMAYEVTKLVHGEEEAKKVQKASEDLFSGKAVQDSVPSYTLDLSELDPGIDLADLMVKIEMDPGIDLADLMVKIEMAKSKGEVRRLLAQGGIYLNGERVEENPYTITEEDVQEDDSIMLRKGKKTYQKVLVRKPKN